MYFPYAHKPPTKKSSSCATLVPSTMKDHSKTVRPRLPLPQRRKRPTPAFSTSQGPFRTCLRPFEPVGSTTRSEEHTSELQSRENLVCRLLLEKKKTT